MTDDILALAHAALEDDAQPCQVINLASCVCGRGTKSCVTHHGLREHALAREVIRLSKELRAALTCNENAKTYIEKLDFKAERDALRAELEFIKELLPSLSEVVRMAVELRERRAQDLTPFERIVLDAHRDRLAANDLEDRTLVAILDKLIAAAEGRRG